MRKLFLPIVALALASTAAQGQNLLANPDFSDISPTSGWEAFDSVLTGIPVTDIVSVSGTTATLLTTTANEQNFYQSFLSGQGDALAVGTYEFSSDLANITLTTGTATPFVKVFDGGWGFIGDEFQGPGAVAGTNTLTFAVDDPAKIYQVGWFITGEAGASMDISSASLTLVPEPSTFALIGGFAALGFVIYRRRKSVKA